jgi:hypothetical protein
LLPAIDNNGFQSERIKDFSARFAIAVQNGIDQLLCDTGMSGKARFTAVKFAGSAEKFSNTGCVHV